MKKILFISLIGLFLLNGCKKDSVTSPVEGSWKLTHFIVSGTDLSASYLTTFSDYQMHFSNNGSMTITYTSSSTNQPKAIAGSFVLKDNNTVIDLYSAHLDVVTAKILQLDNQYFRHIYESDGDSIERRFIKI